jgi:hypothetical protein
MPPWVASNSDAPNWHISSTHACYGPLANDLQIIETGHPKHPRLVIPRMIGSFCSIASRAFVNRTVLIGFLF